MAQMACPVCGERNPDHHAYCRVCGSALHEKLPDAPSSVTEPAGPEPVIPQWLKDALAMSDQVSGEAKEMEGPGRQAGPVEQASASDRGRGEENLDWLRRLTQGAEPRAGDSVPPSPAEARGEGQAGEGSEAGRTETSSDQPTVLGKWLQRSRQTLPEDPASRSELGIEDASTVPDWIGDLRAKGVAAGTPESSSAEEWRRSEAGQAQGEANLGAPGPLGQDEELPEWLVRAMRGSEGTAPPPQSAQPGPASMEGLTAGKAGEVQESTRGFERDEAPQPARPLPTTTSTIEQGRVRREVRPPPPQTASEPAEDDSLPNIATGGLHSPEDAEHLFIDLPDWLSGSATASASSLDESSTTEPLEARPASLPSWLEGMRPDDAAELRTDLDLPTGGASGFSARETDPDRSSEDRLIDLEFLASLASGIEDRDNFPRPPQREAPAPPQRSPESPPATPVDAKVQRTEVPLLDQLLGESQTAAPLLRPRHPAAVRPLRWLIASALVVVTAGMLLNASQSPIVPAPASEPATQALDLLRSIADLSPLLIMAEYAPARAAELEMSATPLLQDLLARRHPRLALVSTSATGPLLAERLLEGAPAARGYQEGIDRVNLGYLPGGTLGISAFARGPLEAKPVDLTLQSSADAQPLENVTALSDFAALLLVTDSADLARAWIEQSTGLRGTAVLVVIASAQAAPLIQPYFQSGQIDGLVSGMQDGASLETRSSGTGSAKAYWNIYTLGMLLSAAVLMGAALWNVLRALQGRASGGAPGA